MMKSQQTENESTTDVVGLKQNLQLDTVSEEDRNISRRPIASLMFCRFL